jgi:carbon monoxide dehydrogenase subunit G
MSVTFQVQFLPLSNGEQNATVSIANDDSDENPYTFSIKGAGIGAPEMAVLGNGTVINSGDTTPGTSDDTDFGSTDVGSYLSGTFTIENSGNAALDLTGSPLVQISGSGSFFVASQPTNDPVPADGGTSTFEIQFLPASTGELNATVSIANDDSDENPYTFSVRGTGIAAPPTLSNPTASSETTTASLGATIDSYGGSLTILDYGVYWNTASPAESGTKCSMGSGFGISIFAGNCAGMQAGTEIYFRGYAENTEGTGYSPEDTFYTEPLQAADLDISAVTSSSMTVSWTNDQTSAGALVVMSNSSTPLTSLSDETEYSGSSIWPSGDEVGQGYYAVYRGPGSSVNVTSLNFWTTYHVWVYAYSGSGPDINYQQDARVSGTA